MLHELVVYTGPMFSSKTSKLLMKLEKYRFKNKNIIAFKPKIDNRYSEECIVTHSGWQFPAIPISSGEEIFDYIKKHKLKKFDVIAVDELFMIKDLSNALISAYCNNYNVVISTLDLSAQLTMFDEIKQILPWATHVEKCTAVCTICGNDAQYTFKKSTKNNKQIIEVGGKEKYEPRCFKHHPMIKLL